MNSRINSNINCNEYELVVYSIHSFSIQHPPLVHSIFGIHIGAVSALNRIAIKCERGCGIFPAISNTIKIHVEIQFVWVNFQFS